MMIWRTNYYYYCLDEKESYCMLCVVYATLASCHASYITGSERDALFFLPNDHHVASIRYDDDDEGWR